LAKVAQAAQFEFGIVVDGRQGTGDGRVSDLDAADEFGAHFFEGGGVRSSGRECSVKSRAAWAICQLWKPDFSNRRGSWADGGAF